MRVLVVEDDLKIAGFIADGLRQEGYAPEWAADGEAGLRLASGIKSGFDVVVLDLMLPRLDGFGVLAALREQAVQTPVLMLSALDSVDDRVRGLRAGADDYLVKPFAIDELIAIDLYEYVAEARGVHRIGFTAATAAARSPAAAWA